MTKLVITIDVEAHRLRDEIRGEHDDSLGDILAALCSFDMRATFFVDLCEVRTWGEEFMRSTCRRILDAGQDLQLHAHPHHVTKNTSRWLLSEYAREEQAAVIDFAVDRYRDFVGKVPLAFRAGGFGADTTTLELLRERGIPIDSSLMTRWLGCHLPDPTPGVPYEIDGLLEIPLTPVLILGTAKRPLRTMAIDFNWLPGWQLRRILRRLKREEAPLVSLLMHSSSLCVRIGSRRLYYLRGHRRKLIELLAFIRDEGWHVTTLDQLDLTTLPSRPTIEFCETSFVHQYVNLLYRSIVGATFRPKLALFLVANLLLALVLLGVGLWAALV
jgi:peptidoglycan/xylan/chitin deacetylase (PgdA/CDA1 family)